MQRITPCLWFNNNAEDAVRFYTATFPNSHILEVTRYSDTAAQAAGRAKGSIMTILFEAAGLRIMALNGGPSVTFTPAVSLIVNCQTQQELDILWGKLSHGGTTQQCGWLKDRFGVSWQIVPAIVAEMMQDPTRAERAMQALLRMQKIDIPTLQRAANPTR